MIKLLYNPPLSLLISVVRKVTDNELMKVEGEADQIRGTGKQVGEQVKHAELRRSSIRRRTRGAAQSLCSRT